MATSRFSTFERDIRIATQGLTQQAISAELARVAVQELNDAIASGQASPIYDRYVNGRIGLPETSVIAPGPILYVFAYWREILEFALEYLRRRSPVDSGAYRDGHHALVDLQPVTPLSPISADSEVVITNRRPYTRKIEVGAMKMKVPPGVYEDARKEVRRRFGLIVDVKVRFIELPNPYILKRDGGRRGRRAGDPLSYPALVMNMKG